MSDSLGKRIQRLRGTARVDAIREVVSRWEASRSSRVSFCKAEGIATVTLGRWIRELQTGESRRRKRPVLVEVGLHGGVSAASYEVVLPVGVTVRVPVGFREEDLIKLLGVVASAC